MPTDRPPYPAELDDEQIDRYARQIIVPGIGARGQAVLLASKVAVLGSDAGRAVAERYLKAAGVQIADDDEEDRIDCVLVADAVPSDAALRDRLAGIDAPAVWYVIDGGTLRGGMTRETGMPNLEHADAAAPAIDASSDALQAAAACDAAAAVVALLLGWTDLEARFDIALG